MQKECVQCRQSFDITTEDQAFYKDMGVPSPTHCYMCRMQRRLSYRNERHLYHRKCDLSGKQIVSSFSIDKPFPVYDMVERQMGSAGIWPGLRLQPAVLRPVLRTARPSAAIGTAAAETDRKQRLL
jgi:hypothetical protein